MLTAVTGATGHLGNNLVRALLERGQRVRALIFPADDARSIDGLAVERVHGDVCDLDSLLRAFDGADTVFHLAGLISIVPGQGDLLHRVNAVGTRNVVEACLRSGVRRLVHTASIHALVEPPHGVTIDERMPFDPKRIATAYGRSKAQAALEVLEGVERGLDAVIVCPSGVVGPHDFQPSSMGRLFLNVAQRRLPAYIRGAYDFVDVRDVVRGQIAAAEKGRRGQTYILSGETVSVAQLMAYLEEATGVRAPRLGIPVQLVRGLARIADLYARLTKIRPILTSESIEILISNCRISHEKAGRELDYAPRPIRETVADTIRWFRDVGMLPIHPLSPLQEALRWLRSLRKVFRVSY